MRDLIRRDQGRTEKLAELQRLITEGIESGVSTRSANDTLKAARKQAMSLAREHGPEKWEGQGAALDP